MVSEARFLSNTLAFAQGVEARCGPVSRGWWMFRQTVYLMSAEANEAVLFDREGRFSAKKGWERVLAELFPQLCQACDEHGQQYSDEEIVDHLIFLMMAAHDTTTSAITTMVYAMARHPQWQERLRVEARTAVDRLRVAGRSAATLDDLATMTQTEWVFKEALRLYQPLPTIARRALADVEIHGMRIPAGTPVAVFPIQVHRSPRWWSEPDHFDPERFSPARAEHRRHPFAWVPFGGGAHMCLGLHFA